MMVKLLLSACCVLVLLTGCGGTTASPTSQDGGTGGTNVSSELNLVVALQGQLFVKRGGWKDYAPALFGTALRRGDLLRLDSSSQAKVACADLQVADITGGVGGLPCHAERPLITLASGEIISTRGGATGSYPMVISPRKTSLLDPHPTLRWSAMDGASGYTVGVHGSGVDWTNAGPVQGTELPYPSDAPPLQAGQTYKVLVQAGDAGSDQEDLPGLGFTMLPADEAQAVRDAVGRIQALKLDAASEKLLVAHLYEGHKLYAEAIEQLQSIPDASKLPAVTRLLGDLYFDTDLSRQAEQQYLAALAISKGDGDIEGQALTQEKLGQVYAALGNKTQAATQFQQALDVYTGLGDSTMSAQINKELAGVK